MKAEQRVHDRYVLAEQIGRGGMAEVWRARDERLERDVAIKFMAANLCHDPEFLVRFFSEAQAVARISHPNVVSVLDFGDFEDRPYLVMEHVGGGALSDLTGEPLLPERAVELVAAAARGAGAAHRAGLVHRDVKPANILLDETGEPKLADFGIVSSAPSENLTATGTAIGSPHYISPEQASGRPVTAASDVYSLGAVLYELLTGAPPFDADNITAIAIAHVEQAPVPPSARVDGIPEQVDTIVLSCLAKDPMARPQDGDALAAALENGVAAATALGPAVVDDDLYDENGYEQPPVKKRWLVPALLAASLVLALAGAMYVTGRPDDVAEAGTTQRPRRDATAEPKKPTRPTPSPSVAASSAPVAVPVATPSPTPSPEREDEGATPEPEPEDDEGPLWTPDPTDEPEPTPAPSQEPDPTPAPSEEPAASEEPAWGVPLTSGTLKSTGERGYVTICRLIRKRSFALSTVAFTTAAFSSQ